MDRRLRVLAGAAGAATVAAVAVVGFSGKGGSAEAKAPALPRETLVGPPVTLSSLLAGAGGRPAVVVFWASWCGPCEREAPAIERFARSSAGRGRVAGVDWSDELSSARTFIKRYGWTFPNVRDAEGAVGSAYHLTVLPTSFVIDQDQHVKLVLRGPQDPESLSRALASVERAA